MQIVCYGDSNTYGYDPRSFLGARYCAEDRWVDQIASQTGWNIRNAGMNGREIPRNIRTRFSEKLATDDVLIVMLGTNDLLQGASAKEVSDRMDAFLISLLPQCRQIILVAPPPMKRGSWVASDELVASSMLLCDEYKKLAEKRNIAFVDTRSWNIDLTFDGVHFSETGHHNFAMQLQKYLQTPELS